MPAPTPAGILIRFAARRLRGSSSGKVESGEGGRGGASRLLRRCSFAAASAEAGEIWMGLSMPVPPSTRMDEGVRCRGAADVVASGSSSSSCGDSSNASEEADDCERRTEEVVIDVEVVEVEAEDVLCDVAW